MRKVALVFVPSPGVGHFVPMAEFAKCLLDRDERLSITILVMKPPSAPPIVEYTQSADTRIRYVNLPQQEPPSDEFLKSPEQYLSVFIESHKPHVKDAIIDSVLSDSVSLFGLVFDLFCTPMIDVANELGVPSYLFFTSSAAFLGLMLHLPVRHSQIGTAFSLSDPDSIIPSYANPVPASVLPSVVLNKEGGYTSILNHSIRFRETKGIIINTFTELEPHAVHSLVSDAQVPPVYTIGPLLDLKGQKQSESDHGKIMKWLNHQPPSSVLFLCFGSLGTFQIPQLAQIATALEQSGQRFLWSIRQPPPRGKFAMPSEYMNYEDILPEGFSERTSQRGMVCGWAPQVELLVHRAIGGFVSHCGWNSILESLWHGVPIVTWPIYAEQQINAFEMVKELGLAVELKLDYRMGDGEQQLVMAEEIENAIRCIMDDESPVKKKVKEMGEKSRKAVVDAGTSFFMIGRFIQDVIGNHAWHEELASSS